MRLEEYMQLVLRQGAASQHAHEFVRRFNMALKVVSDRHLWSWLVNTFYIKTAQPYVFSGVYTYNLTANKTLAVPGIDPTLHAYITGRMAKIEFGGHEPIYRRIVNIGKQDGPVEAGFVTLDDYTNTSLSGGTMTVYRDVYIPKHGELYADRLLDYITKRENKSERYATRRPRHEYLRGYAPSDPTSVSDLSYQTVPAPKLPAPLYAPVFTSVGSSSSNYSSETGNYYLAYAYCDDETGAVSELGPVTKYSETVAAAGRTAQFVYGAPNAVHELSYTMRLYITPADPAGLDGRVYSETEARTEAPWYEAGTQVGLGGTGSVVCGSHVVRNTRHAPTPSTAQAVRFSGQTHGAKSSLPPMFPEFTETLAVSGRTALPMYKNPDDHVLVPENMAELLVMWMAVNTREAAGADASRSRSLFEYTLKQRIAADLMATKTSDVDDRYFFDG